MPFAAQVVRHAAERPRHPALRGPSGEVSYGELAAMITRDRGHRPGQLVPLTLPDPIDLLAAALAAEHAGATPLICDPTWSEERRCAVLSGMPADLPSGGWACFTSGSTGRPRAVLRSRESWAGSFPHLDALTGIGPDDVVLVPGSLVSSLYGFAAVHTLAAGATAVMPGRWPAGDLAAHLRDATAAHLVPHQLPAVLEHDNRLRVAVVGGAALHERPPGLNVVAYYGATELSFVAVDTDGTGLRPFPEVEVEVRDGELWVRSPWLAHGYLAGAEGPLRRDAGGWTTVGDLAEPYRPGGKLRLRGRGDGAIQTGGATVVPEDVEAVLRRVPGVGDVVVLGSPHPELGSVVTAVVEGSASRAALEAVARGGLDPVQRPRRWYTADALPRTPTGKPARALIAAVLDQLKRL
ncbi:AMP-binding protein [Nonomuraea sp. NPDC050536]|uniref:AMP-binding protein n=1 Tax=Nonomuraea sp. NPDC050536 TaxID=3364366 RepID=UPI0037CC7DEF